MIVDFLNWQFNLLTFSFIVLTCLHKSHRFMENCTYETHHSVKYTKVLKVVRRKNKIPYKQAESDVSIMSMNKYFRHTPAFILLFLAQKPAYGALLFKRLDEEMPFNLIDTPALYRALNGLEKEGAIEAYWDTSEPGPAKKMVSNNSERNGKTK